MFAPFLYSKRVNISISIVWGRVNIFALCRVTPPAVAAGLVDGETAGADHLAPNVHQFTAAGMALCC
jgi:hypothetical protein